MLLSCSADTFPSGSIAAGCFRWQRPLVDQSEVHAFTAFLHVLSKRVSLPIPAPRSLHSLLETAQVHLRKPFQLSCPLTPAHECGELLHVGKHLPTAAKPR